jgi:hypothetical protein
MILIMSCKHLVVTILMLMMGSMYLAIIGSIIRISLQGWILIEQLVASLHG